MEKNTEFDPRRFLKSKNELSPAIWSFTKIEIIIGCGRRLILHCRTPKRETTLNEISSSV